MIIFDDRPSKKQYEESTVHFLVKVALFIVFLPIILLVWGIGDVIMNGAFGTTMNSNYKKSGKGDRGGGYHD